MPRKRRGPPAAEQAPAPAPAQALPPVPVIDPHALFYTDTLQQVCRLRAGTIRREVRERRLRVAKRAGRYFFLGAWVLEWLTAGEVGRAATTPRPADPDPGDGSAA